MDDALHQTTAVLLIDAQPAFVDGMHGPAEPLLLRLERLLMLAEMLDLPLLATFERPTESKGWLPPRLEAVFPSCGQRYEKSTFDCMAEPSIRGAVERLGRRHLAVAGAETDVCVLQSVLSALRLGYRVSLLEDCLFSSEANVRSALRRMTAAGAVPSTFKTLAYELIGTVDRGAWPAAWEEKLARHGDLFPPPEDLPPR